MRWICFFCLSFLTLAYGDSFKPFTGKVTANKVRIRVKPDLDSHIICQINKNALLLVVGEEGDFLAVEPLKGTKAYVFRSYILDEIVEANRVNVRLEPRVDAPIIGQLQAGQRVQGRVCPLNHKWYEIPPPQGTHFYVSKEYVVRAGGAEYLAAMEKRKEQAEECLRSAYLLAEAECKKSYEEMKLEEATEAFQALLQNFVDFPEITSQAKEGLALLKETYLNKKILYLEAKAELTPHAKEELIAQHKADNEELLAEVQIDPNLWSKRSQKREISDGAREWDAMEEALFLNWATYHSGKKIEDFYAEQRANSTLLTGTIEPYPLPIKDKPGNFLLKGAFAPIAYLYSTHLDLDKYAGKRVTVMASPRPNHSFAFPAYFVLSIEE